MTEKHIETTAELLAAAEADGVTVSQERQARAQTPTAVTRTAPLPE